MSKTRALSRQDFDHIRAQGVCLACKQHGNKYNTIQERHRFCDEDGELSYRGTYWVCSSGASHEHFQLSPGSDTSGPRITAGLILPSERMETPYDRSKAVVRRTRVTVSP